MKFFCSFTPKYLRNHLSWELSWTPSQKVFLNDAWTPSFQRTLLASKRFTIVHCRLRNMDHPSLIMLHWSNVNWYRCIHVSFLININQTHQLFTSFQKIWNNADLNEKINDLLMWVHWQTLWCKISPYSYVQRVKDNDKVHTVRKNSFLFETSPFKQLWNEFYLAVAAKHTTEDFFLLKLIRKAFLMSLIFWTVFTSRAQSNLKKKLQVLNEVFLWNGVILRWLDPVILWGYHTTLVSPYQNYHTSVSIRKSAKRGHCTLAEQECCIMTD